MRIGLFGGSFDPVHLGHLEIAALAKKSLGLDKIIVIPNANPPHKKTFAAPMDRYRMVIQAFEDFEACEVSPKEMEPGACGYTLDTVRYYREKYEGSRLFYIAGMDSLANMDKWRGSFNILDTIEFVIFSRPGFEPPVAKSLLSRVKILDYSNAVSSTKIRRLIKTGEDCSFLLKEKVLRYIKSNGIYG